MLGTAFSITENSRAGLARASCAHFTTMAATRGFGCLRAEVAQGEDATKLANEGDRFVSLLALTSRDTFARGAFQYGERT